MEEGEEGKDGEFVPLSTHIIHIRARKDRDLSPLWQIEGITEGTREGGGRGGAASQIDRVITLFSSSETVETFSISLPTLLGVQFQIWGSEARGDATERKEKLVLQQCDHRMQSRAAHSGHRRAAVHMALRTVHSLAQSQFSKTCAVSVSQSKSGFEGG